MTKITQIITIKEIYFGNIFGKIDIQESTGNPKWEGYYWTIKGRIAQGDCHIEFEFIASM